MQMQNFGGVEEQLKMTDGFNLFCRKWPSSSQIDRVIVFLHGIEVHSGAFRFMGPELASDNSEVYSFDRRGFGNSKEADLPRGDTCSFDRHLDDLKEVVEHVRQIQPGKKVFIFGHSIGCTYTLWYAAKYPQQVDGIILAAPPLKTGFKVPTSDTLKLVFSPIVHHHSMYNFVDGWPQSFKVSEEYKLITGDQLCTKEFGLGFLFDLQIKLVNKMLQNVSKINKPVLLLHGDKDVIALPISSNKILEKLPTEDKTLQVFPDADHWFYQSIIPSMGSTYDLEKKKKVSAVANDWLRKH